MNKEIYSRISRMLHANQSIASQFWASRILPKKWSQPNAHAITRSAQLSTSMQKMEPAECYPKKWSQPNAAPKKGANRMLPRKKEPAECCPKIGASRMIPRKKEPAECYPKIRASRMLPNRLLHQIFIVLFNRARIIIYIRLQSSNPDRKICPQPRASFFKKQPARTEKLHPTDCCFKSSGFIVFNWEI